VLTEAPQHLPALFDLARWEERRRDDAGLADALERQLVLLEDEGLRLPVAVRLADLYEGPLADDARAIDALHAWIDCDLMDAAPRERLVARLETNQRWPELVDALDGLAGVEVDEEAQGALVRRAAELAASHLGDVDGAWERLAPRVVDDPEAERQIRALADTHGRHEALAELFIRLAQTASAPATQRARWLDAARVLEGPGGDVGKALEAVLRAYALDLADEALLGEVDRLAAASGNWARLAQVYDTLLRSVETPRAKKKLLVRHARLLDSVGDDASGALDRALRACALDPEDEALLGYVEDLAPRAGRAEELLVVYDRRRSAAKTDEARADALLRAAHLCDVDLRDRDRAFGYVAQAVALSVRTPSIGPSIERAVAELDDLAGGRDARERLVAVYRRLADDAEHDPRAAAALFLRAARLLEDALAAPEEAFACLDRASQDAPIPEVLDALEGVASRLRRFDALDARLASLVADALDSQTAADLLRRRGRVLEERLHRLDEAAEVYRQLLTVARDEDAADRLLGCLRKARRHQDLLVALDQEASRTRSSERRLELLREIATVWEKQLANKWEAQDAWKKVLSIAPDDPVATEAIHRLGVSTRRLHPDDLVPSGETDLAELEDVVEDAEHAVDVAAADPATVQASVAVFEEDTPSLEDALPPFEPGHVAEVHLASAPPSTTPAPSLTDAPSDFADLVHTASELDDDESLFADEAPSSEHVALFDDVSPSVDRALLDGSDVSDDARGGASKPAAHDSGVVTSPPVTRNPFGRREGTAPLMEGFPDDIHTHVEADASLDDEFPPLPGATGGTLDDALPYAATVAATLDPASEDDVEPVPVRDEGTHDARREGIRAASMREEPAVDLGTGELLAFADASSAELLDSGELDAEEVLDDLDDLDDADLLDDDDLVEDAPRAKTSLPPPPPRRND
jgi:tetratricopeptide (TPR) repeat protein